MRAVLCWLHIRRRPACVHEASMQGLHSNLCMLTPHCGCA